ncbi:MAG: hypothetical protein EBY73_07980, partial [Burkholderiaceae bacterium]|nr:hypothetical protein [Burkholderiaceae bacterium]
MERLEPAIKMSSSNFAKYFFDFGVSSKNFLRLSSPIAYTISSFSTKLLRRLLSVAGEPIWLAKITSETKKGLPDNQPLTISKRRVWNNISKKKVLPSNIQPEEEIRNKDIFDS